MVTFLIVGAVGLVMLLGSIVVDDLFDFADGLLSATSLGAGCVAFGALGAIVTANGLPTGWAYVAAAVFGILTWLGVQAVVRRLKATEDGGPVVLVGAPGVVTATVTTSGGEVSLDDPRELERRLAWADVEIAVGTRVVVLEQSGSRVKVAPASAPTTTA